MRMKAPMPRLEYVGARLYSAALFLYPPRFRREFSSEMARDFAEATEEARQAGRWTEPLALWTRIAADLAKTAAIQWLRTGLPSLFLCSIAGAMVAASVAASVLARQPVVVPVAAADRDVMALILLVGAVLLVVAATIFFTFWFSRPLLQRHRR
jgi:hypothetical protein